MASHTAGPSPRGAAIVIVNWNGWIDTIECLESVFRSDYPYYRVIVCDNGSQDGSLEKIRGWAEGEVTRAAQPSNALGELTQPPIPKPVPYLESHRTAIDSGTGNESDATPLVLIRIEENLGFAGANNVALQYLRTQPDLAYVWLLNNDTVVAPDALSAMIRITESDPALGMVGSRLLDYDQPTRVQALGGGRVISWQGMTRLHGRGEQDGDRWDTVLDLDYVTGSSLLVRREVVERIGPMDERYFLYSEEVDWCLRARAQGWRLAYAPQSRVWHKEGASFERLSPLQNYCSVRSSLLLTEKFHPGSLPLAFAYSLYRCLLPKIVRRQPHDLLAVLRAYWDFFRHAPAAVGSFSGQGAVRKRADAAVSASATRV